MTSVTATRANPPNPQEISRKLSVCHKPIKKPTLALSPSAAQPPLVAYAHSGGESDSDSLVTPDISVSGSSFAGGPILAHSPQSTSSPPLAPGSANAPALALSPALSSIAEAPAGSGEDTDDEEDEPEGDSMWRTVDHSAALGQRGEPVTDIKAGYLWKKGIRRKAWKKRWFVLRPLHVAYYKTSAEYKLLHLLDLHEVHSVSPCAIKRHSNTFVLVCPSRTFYLQASSQQEMENWVQAFKEVLDTIKTTATLTGLEAPTPEPPEPQSAPAAPVAEEVQVGRPRQGSASSTGPPPPPPPPPPPTSAMTIAPASAPGLSPANLPIGSAPPLSSSPLSRRSRSPGHYVTSSDDDEFFARASQTKAPLPNPPGSPIAAAPPMQQPVASVGGTALLPPKDPTKVVLSGYLMKCGQKRRTWRKRWFTLTGKKLVYYASHMDTRAHREIDLEYLLDALEYTPGSRHDLGHGGVGGSGGNQHYPPSSRAGGDGHDTFGVGGAEPKHTFKIVTTKRTLLLSAPSETEEIKWLSTVRALIARRAAPPGSAGMVTAGPASAALPTPSKTVSGTMEKGKERDRERHSRQRSMSSV